MNGMWAVSELPVYAVEPRRKPTKKSKYLLGRNRANSSATVLIPSPSQTTLHNDTDSLRGLLDPAVDGPPSPESLRVAMKQTTIAPEHRQSHHTTSSGSSSLRSLTSTDRPSWENALESLSRKSSGRSATGAMPSSRERPDSVQIFGKTLFNRRGKLKRESSAPSSSAGSSLYSTENGSEAMPPPAVPGTRDSVVPSLFGRRRTATLETSESATRKKFHISGPYNFQHVAHTQRDAGSDVQQTDSAQLLASHATPRGHDLHFADFSSDFLPLREEDELAGSQRPSSFLPKQMSPPRRLLKHSQSQEHMRQPPPRPPRSPVDPSMLMPSPPVPPPRMSSRASAHPDGLDPLDEAPLDRPLTGGSFRQPQPFAFSPAEVSSPTSASQSYFPDMDTIPEHGHARKDSFPGDSNWPLPATPSYESLLANVPEEDESPAAWKPSHVSVASNSSLRMCQSVPMLRPFAAAPREEESLRRPPSNSSDTLGRFDLVAAQQALKAALLDGNGSGSLTREDWEDDIDYVYEHAAEADCEYAWDRPSLDLSRDCESTTPVEDRFRATASSQASPEMLTPAQFDVPALSPVSQMSAVTAHEAITPTLTLPRASNFSLPRADVPSSLQHLHVRKPSDASSFKESHGFNLSPSLLIPNDYQLQMMAAEADAREFGYHPFDEPSLSLDTSILQRYRTSASTTGTFESSQSGFEKHMSAASSSTDFTRLTASTGSLDMESYSVKAETLQPFPALETHTKAAMPTLPETEEVGSAAAARSHPFGGRSSESNLKRFVVDDPLKRKDSIIARRQRARTTSLSTPPPAHQYALFPSSHLSGARI
ncbi:hypothetical protein QBC39DRAFT_172748 [Podospora conica]|nr:hypothetical protein QBC39DRAFT_172748 [Schizothecium conicum]